MAEPTFEQTFSGPPAGRDGALTALRAAGFDADTIASPYPDERDKAWLVARSRHPQTPTADEQADAMTRAADAADRHGFELRMHAIPAGVLYPGGV